MLFNSKYSKIEYDNNNEIFFHTWKIESISMTDNNFVAEMQYLTRFLKLFKPLRILIDLREFYFNVMTQMQFWVDDNVNKVLLQNNCQKVAFVYSSNIVSNLTVEQTFNRNYSSKLNVAFFKDFNKAMKWIKV